MTTGLANRHRRLLTRGLAGLAVIVLGIGSILLTAMTEGTLAIGTPSRAAPPSSAPPSVAASPTSAIASATPVPPVETASPTMIPVTPSPSPTGPPEPTVTEYRVAPGSEPSLAADPFDPGVVAVLSQNIFASGPTSGCNRPSVRISRDGGATWGAPAYPWAGQCQDIHAVIAWGPGSRLWAGDAVGVPGGVAMAVTYSDDFGKTWRGRFVQNFTKPWSGCFPSITVDDWPGSPNFGTVYVAYNWLPNSLGPAVEVMATRNGSAWVATAVHLAAPPPGYPYSWRIGYRVEAAPDGTAVVSFYQSNLKSWNEDSMLSEGSPSNIGRMGFETALIHFDGKHLSADPPAWAISVDRTSSQWQSGLAVDDSGQAWMAVETGGGISVGPIGGSWQKLSVPGKSSFKPSLAMGGGIIFVGWHAEDPNGRVWTYYTLSYDGGLTFLPPALVTAATWYPSSAPQVNGVGLRENADFADGVFYYAYGDARSGTAVYMAQVRP